jgi:hypothetical protein
MYDIEVINTMPCCVDYSAKAYQEYDDGQGDGIEKYRKQFEQDYASDIWACTVDDIGGLVVYARDGVPVMVYDYENFCGWKL